MKYRHGGNLAQLAAAADRPVEEILDFSASINPLGPPEWLRAVISRHVDRLGHYPDAAATDLCQAIAKRHGVSADRVVAANGSTEIIYALPRILGLARALIPIPSYFDYTHASKLSGLETDTVPLRKADGFALDWAALTPRLRGGEMVWLGRPNNPTGATFDVSLFAQIVRTHRATVFVVDESFADFMSDGETLAVPPRNNVIVLKSLTKFYGVPGLRLGCAFADHFMAEQIREGIGPWSVNTLAQAVGEAAMGDEEYARQTRRMVGEERNNLAAGLGQIKSLRVYPGTANYLLVESLGTDAATLARHLLVKGGIAVRVCDNFAGLDGQFFRVAVRTGEENGRLLEALQAVLTRRSAPAPQKKHAIMFQGTGSNAGKSVLTTALCRILLQDGVRVAPFKAQNMSLNSFVTRDGGEMGRAQVVQAQACRLEPDVRMNPVLLKPNSDTGSQVIFRGRPVGNMHFSEYMNYKIKIFAEVAGCYDSLAAQYDAVVLEGAGSPAEVNLKRHEIVNMRMARHAEAQVLLVGDIDRGGLLASFVGTMELLTAEERRRIAGFVINRFRGDEALLRPALDYVLAHTGKTTLGVVPFIADLNLPEEDSLDFRRRPVDDGAAAARVDIAVIDLPRISNFTDFDSLRGEPDVCVRFVGRAEDLGTPDAVILPGSKNTIADLHYLRGNGLADRLRGLAGRVPIIGICAGFQMLGKKISDPHRIETAAGECTDGLGLLDVTTVIAPGKTLLRVRARHVPSGMDVQGYEVHHGLSNMNGHEPVLQRQDGMVIGVSGWEGLVWGTYLHGVFDADQFRRWFIDRLRISRGLSPIGRICAPYNLEIVFDRLADIVRSHLDMDKIYRLMGL